MEGAVVKKGSRVEFGVADGKRGAQALSARVIDAPRRVSKSLLELKGATASRSRRR